MEYKYPESHPWLDFTLRAAEFPPSFWVNLGECVSKCYHLRNTAMSEEIKQYIYEIYLSKGAAATTAIEGNTLTEDQVRHIVAKESAALPPDYQEQERQVENVADLYDEIFAQAEKSPLPPLSPEIIIGFQERILRNLSVDGAVGSIRRRSVVVGRYRGAPPEECAHLLQRLCDWLKNDPGFKQLKGEIGRRAAGIIRAALAHLYIAWIHPFDDGNGRAARMAEFYCLVAAGVPAAAAHLSSNHCNQQRDMYYRRLAEASRSRSPTDFICFIVAGLRDGLREQLRYVYAEHVRLVWNDYTESKITGTANTRERRVKLAQLLAAQTSPLTASQLIAYPAAAVLYLRDGGNVRLISNDLSELEKIRIVTKEDGGYKANLALLQGMKPRAAV